MPALREVLPGVFLGDQEAAGDKAALKAAGITRMLSLGPFGVRRRTKQRCGTQQLPRGVWPQECIGCERQAGRQAGSQAGRQAGRRR